MPALVVLSSTCEVEVWDGVDLVRGAYSRAVRQWCKGKCLFWSREAREGEYVWDGVICHQCYMSPIRALDQEGEGGEFPPSDFSPSFHLSPNILIDSYHFMTYLKLIPQTHESD